MFQIPGPPRLPEPYHTIRRSFETWDTSSFLIRLDGAIYSALGFYTYARLHTVLHDALYGDREKCWDVINRIDELVAGAIGLDGAMRLQRALNQTQR